MTGLRLKIQLTSNFCDFLLFTRINLRLYNFKKVKKVGILLSLMAWRAWMPRILDTPTKGEASELFFAGNRIGLTVTSPLWSSPLKITMSSSPCSSQIQLRYFVLNLVKCITFSVYYNLFVCKQLFDIRHYRHC